MLSAFAWCSFWSGSGSIEQVRQSDLLEGITRVEWLHNGEALGGEKREIQNNLDIRNSLSFEFLALFRMISPVLVGPLLSLRLPILIATNAGSSCDAQGQPGRSQHATDQQVCKCYFLLSIWLNCEHVIFLLVEFSRSPTLRLVAQANSEDDPAV